MSTEVIEVLVTAIVVVVGLLLKQVVLVRLTPRQLQVVTELARTAVEAAEEVGRTLNLDGAAKYEYAETALTTGAKRVGVKLKPEEANSFIHAVLGESRTLFELQQHLTESEESVSA